MTDEKENREQFTALKNDKKDDSTLECAVCLQNCVHPIKLACEHIFCFLCAKGVANKNQPCPLCRQDISFSLIDKPRLVSIDEDTSNDEKIDIAPNDCSWFYEGRNGWWEYEERLVGEIEEAFQQSKNELNLDDGTLTNNSLSEFLIAGYMYVIDFNLMVQFRKDNPSRKRRIKRDQKDNIHNYKGVAGLRKKN